MRITTSHRGAKLSPQGGVSAEPHDGLDSRREFRSSRLHVIRLLFFDRVPRQTLRFNRRNIFAARTETNANIAASISPPAS